VKHNEYFSAIADFWIALKYEGERASSTLKIAKKCGEFVRELKRTEIRAFE
jgi:hypothetical protein